MTRKLLIGTEWARVRRILKHAADWSYCLGMRNANIEDRRRQFRVTMRGSKEGMVPTADTRKWRWSMRKHWKYYTRTLRGVCPRGSIAERKFIG